LKQKTITSGGVTDKRLRTTELTVELTQSHVGRNCFVICRGRRSGDLIARKKVFFNQLFTSPCTKWSLVAR